MCNSPGRWRGVPTVDLVGIGLLLLAVDDGQAKTQSLGIGVGLLGHSRITGHNHRVAIVGNLRGVSHLIPFLV